MAAITKIVTATKNYFLKKKIILKFNKITLRFQICFQEPLFA